VTSQDSSAAGAITAAIEPALRFLLDARDSSGLWPYLAGRAGALEPSIWALLASSAKSKTSIKSVDYILAKQNKDGGWSSELQNDESDWSSYFTFFGLNVLKQSLPPSEKLESSCTRAFDFVMNSRVERYTAASRFLLLIWKGADYDYNRGWA
jgi:hypothetical protein